MRKLFLLCFLFLSVYGSAQTYQNSWIDYSRTYYKIKIITEGLYRIPKAALDAAGIGDVPAEQFQLWRNGQTQPLYVSRATGVFDPTDYIEFYGVPNDGKPDQKLYLKPEFQLSDKTSLISDTSAYFLTVNPGGNNKHLTDGVNDVSGNTLPVEPYFMNKKGYYFRNIINGGQNTSVGGVNIYSSVFDAGEGWSSTNVAAGTTRNISVSNFNLYAGGPDALLTYAVAGNADNSRTVGAVVNGTSVDEVAFEKFDYRKRVDIPVPLSAFGNKTSLTVGISDASTVTTDRMVISYWEVTYPSIFSFDNQTHYYFELPASATGNFLEITKFTTNGAAPVLYDETNVRRYVGDISQNGKVRFVLPASATSIRKFHIASTAAADVHVINNLTVRNFVDYSKTANQGDYIIISNPVLYNSSDGRNYVDEYRQYRASAAGGGFKPVVVDVNEITDQFAYGIDKHPLGVKEFLQFAADKFNPKPAFVFIIGKGLTYDAASTNAADPNVARLNLVPTFGNPGSDILLSAGYGGAANPRIPIGRVPVISGDEAGIYFQKVKQYEGEQSSNDFSTDARLWMKNVMQVVGGHDSAENALFRNYMNNYRQIFEDTALGSHVELFSKSSNAAVQLATSNRLKELFEEGVGIISYFGHSSATTLDYDLSDPMAYNNSSKYPVFLVSGCTVGNNFIFDPNRVSTGSGSVSENFVLTKDRGSIAFMASTHYGIVSYLNDYNTTFYNQMGKTNYGAPLGVLMKKTVEGLDGNNPDLQFLARADLEEMNLNGDPALKPYAQPKPDYVIDETSIEISPAFISISNQNFNVSVKGYNLGKAIKDSIVWEAKRTLPDGSTAIVYREKRKAPYYADSISFSVPIVSVTGKGSNKITVTIDADNKVSEMSEDNNSYTKEFFIFEDEATPVYPANFAIVTTDTVKMYASTADPLAKEKDYTFQIDTTGLFNSPRLVSKDVKSIGGLLAFDPGISFTDNTVYYWRVMVHTDTTTADNAHWNQASFVYLKNSSEGSNQSHYFQHLYSDTSGIRMNDNRVWEFGTLSNVITTKSAVFPTGYQQAEDFVVQINGAEFTLSPCGVSGIIFNILNPRTLKPWTNTNDGLYGSDPVCAPDRITNFQYNILSQQKRIDAFHFLKDSVPDGYIVVVRNISGTNAATNTYADDWKGDTSVLGAGNSLYNILYDNGFVTLDSFNRPRAFSFIYQKGNRDFEPAFIMSEGIYDKIELNHPFISTDSIGYITSPKFGPAVSWKQLHWSGRDLSTPATSDIKIQVIGVRNDNTESVVTTIPKSQKDVDVSFINPAEFPYLKLKMRNADSIHLDPFQLDYWRLNFEPVPEGALAPQLLLESKDTLYQGEPFQFAIAFKNISRHDFDSLKVRVSVTDSKNVPHEIQIPKQKALISGDTILLRFTVDTKTLLGKNTLYVDFNPDNDQPEQYHFNNFLYHDFYVTQDQFNPLLDVTFDGIHILNRDIVSAKPHIVIKLEDDNRYLKLEDTSLVKVQLKYTTPEGTDILRTIHFDGDTLRLTPSPDQNGTATIDFNPAFPAEDNEYELIVSGTDASGNPSGSIDYHVSFRVIGQAMITEMLNYPNPFTTSTAFVFTLTGSEVPQELRIQILTVTGKIVREITKQELGPIRIGRNITEFKWDGTDMYGQRLANGVYLYRVLTNLNGKSLKRFDSENNQMDPAHKFFKGGYGKMYLMR